MGYFNIMPRNNYIQSNNEPIPLKVITDDGINLTPGFKINVTELNNGYKNFVSNSDKGNTFKVKIILKKSDVFNCKINGTSFNTVRDVLDYIIKNSMPVMIQTEALDVPTRDMYIITSNPSRVQTKKNDTIWELEFHTYSALNLFKYQNNNSAVLNAIKKAKAKQKKSTKSASVKYAKLASCNYKVLVYSKKKKVVNCVKYLQEVLKRNKVYTGKIDGWYGPETLKAVKKYQQNYNKKYKVTNIVQSNSGGIFNVSAGKLVTGKKNKTTVKTKTAKISKRLSVTGKVDKATWTALYKGE